MRAPAGRRSACRARATRWSPRPREVDGVRLPVRPQDHPRRVRRQGRVVRRRGRASARDAFDAAEAAGVQVLAEELVDFRRELSALVARSPQRPGRGVPGRRVDAARRHLRTRWSPRRRASTPALAVQAQRDRAARSPRELDVTGILAVELFETTDGRILVNELAMRPHNTGHWTQDGAVTCQFENHLRAVLDLPLGVAGARAPLDGDGQHPRRPTDRGRPAVRRLPARPGPRPAAARAPLRQGACARAARSATSTPTATTSRTASSGPGTPPHGSRGDLGDESE